MELETLLFIVVCVLFALLLLTLIIAICCFYRMKRRHLFEVEEMRNVSIFVCYSDFSQFRGSKYYHGHDLILKNSDENELN
jgi:hypothetical protein